MVDNNPIHQLGTRNVTFKVEGAEDGQGYHTPTNSLFGIVVVSEWWGLNQSMCKTADRLAAKGFQCLVPDIYRGKVGINREDAGHLMSGLDFKAAAQYIKGAYDFLKSIGCRRVGITGFCMGGALALATAAEFGDKIDAVAPFYGIPDQKAFPIEKVKCPVFANFGTLDELKGFSDIETARELAKKAKEANVSFTLREWEGCPHAFMNQDREEVFNKEASEQALTETSAFFKEAFKHKK